MDQHFYGPSRKLLKHLNYKAENAKLIFKQVPTTQKPSLNIKHKKLNTKLPYDPAIPFLDIYSEVLKAGTEVVYQCS